MSLPTSAAVNGGDAPCRIFVERCREAMEQPSPDDWDGVYRVKVK
jgi:hypothetical protein